jgi:hypothetical protein
MLPAMTCFLTSTDITIVSGFILLSGISPPNKQNVAPLDPVSTISGEGRQAHPGKLWRPEKRGPKLEITAAGFRFSARDLVGYLNCRHLSALDRAVAEGVLEKPTFRDPLLQVLWERGTIHEQNYVEHLKEKGLDAIRIDGVDVSEKAVAGTVDAMANGATVTAQGALSNNRWGGRADILRRVERPSVFGNWSYEVIDTKLARETKAGTVLQLCLYSDLLQY